MANAKARSTARSARSAAAVSATPTSRKSDRPAKAVEPESDLLDDDFDDELSRPSGQPRWFQLTTLALAILGLGISIYETWAEEFNSAHLAGCPTGGHGTFNCEAVLTSPQSHILGIPVAVLGIVFYVALIPLFSPWAWRLKSALVHQLRLASMIVGMAFVVYLISAELSIGSICEYCTGVHIVTFLLFCCTVFSAAIWGLRGPQESTTVGSDQ
jgi:uncharacterized membrane protein